MIRHFTGSVASAITLLVTLVVVIFVILQLTPGDPIQAIVGEHAVPPELRERLEKAFQINDPFLTRLGNYFVRLMRGDLGFSYGTGIPVTTLLAERAPRTFALAMGGFVLAVIFGLTLGVWAAYARRPGVRGSIDTALLIGYSIPTFWLGQLLVMLFAMNLGWLPTQGMGPVFSLKSGFAMLWERAPYLVLPALTYAIHEGTRVARLMKQNVIQTSQQNFITTARMKGLNERRILWGHVMRNSLLPVITALGYAFGVAMGGTVLIETVFSWPGIGLLLIDSIRLRDNQVVVGIVLFVAVVVVLANLVVDTLYILLDPRIRQRR